MANETDEKVDDEGKQFRTAGKSDKKAKREPNDTGNPHRVAPAPADEAMIAWIEELFYVPGKSEPRTKPNEIPQRVAVRPVFGLGSRDLGPPLRVEEFGTEVPKKENLVAIGNKLQALAQREVDSVGRRQRYGLFAYSNFRGATPYARYIFTLAPQARELTSEQVSAASDDDDTHRDRLLSTALAHSRWGQEQFSEAISGVLKLQQDMIREQRETIRDMEHDRREWIKLVEQSLDKKQEREIKGKWADMQIDLANRGISLAESVLPPLLAGIRKDKAGIVVAIEQFVKSLPDDVAEKLFGDIDANGQAMGGGILSREQAQLVFDVYHRRVDPKELSKLKSSIEMHQVLAAKRLLNEGQMLALMTLVRAAEAADESSAPNGTARGSA